MVLGAQMTPKRDTLRGKIIMLYMTEKEQDAMFRALGRSVKIITAKPKRDSLGRPYYTEAIHPRKKGGRVVQHDCEHKWAETRIEDSCGFGVAFAIERRCSKCGRHEECDLSCGRLGGQWNLVTPNPLKKTRRKK